MTEFCKQDFNCEQDCFYDEEQYTVRDNGSVLRHPRVGERLRRTDGKWTFGKLNKQNGYLHIGSVRIHRIVATAFHGEPPTPQHVVDHIDTNRQNNRPENLRWLTRLENALLNPITVKRIESICGSIDAFLEDPSRLRLGRPNSNFDWMRRVSPQEAKACRDKMLQWAESDKKPSGKGSIGEWIFKPSVARRGAVNEPLEARDLVSAKTPGAAQRNWRIPTEFPCCPSSGEERPISAYLNNLTPGAIFSRNKISTSVVLDAAVTDDDQAVLVICDRPEKDAIKPWTVARVTIEGSLFVHTSLGTFFSEEGAKKEFCLARGHQWTGDDTIDNYC